VPSLLVINDIHIAANRTGGTTQESLEALRSYLHAELKKLLKLNNRVVVNGDFFDSYSVPLVELFRSYETLSEWLGDRSNSITLIPGNHCLSKSSSVFSSFELMSRLLQSQYPDQVRYIQGAGWVQDGVYAVSHVPNQEHLDLELGRIPEGVKYLLLHCNLDSKFAAEASHSLNLDRVQAKALTARGITIVIGHEHQGRETMHGKAIVTGNQAPGSVSDCLGNTTKRALLIENDSYRFIETWRADQESDGWFARVDWQDLASIEEEGRGFIRVEGEATAAQAADVIRAISAFRQRSRSFVVANAVKIETLDDLDDIAQSVEDVRSVDVLELLLEHLEPAQQEAIRKLTGETV